MKNSKVKYLLVVCVLLIYINRGMFVFSYEIDNQTNIETNSVIEWVVQLITGKGNNIDEDGNNQTDCNSVQIAQFYFVEQLTQTFELANLFTKELEKNIFSAKVNSTIKGFLTQIDHPPKIFRTRV